MKKILVATDFSERSDRALRRAVLLAREHGAKIEILHVVDDDQPRRIVEAEEAEAKKLLRQMATTLRSVDNVESDVHVILASPFAGIAQTVMETAPDILLIGPHRRQLLRDVFVGTTAERVIRLVNCPVLMVNAPPVGAYSHVMQTTDLSHGSGDALKRFADLQIGERARRSVLYVFDAPALRLSRVGTMATEEKENYLAEERRDAARQLSAFLSSADIRGLEPLLQHEEAPAAHEIVKVAEKEKADLIVLATHSRGGLANLIIGSITEQVLRASPIDVLAIPPARPK